MMWKEEFVACLEILSGIHLEGFRKTTKDLRMVYEPADI
jgi:hypothetical protein